MIVVVVAVVVVVVAVVLAVVLAAVVLAAVVVAVVKSATLEKHICEMDEERSGNVDIVVELIHCLIGCNLKHAYKKTHRGWLGFTNWGGGGASFYLWGGHRSRGVAFLSSQKQHFSIRF